MHHNSVFNITPCDSCESSFFCGDLAICGWLQFLLLAICLPVPVVAFVLLIFHYASVRYSPSLFSLFNLFLSLLDSHPQTAFFLPAALFLPLLVPLAAHFFTTKMFSW